MNNIKVYLNTLRQNGYLAYEYNPFHNYQTDVDLYLYDDKYLIPANCALNPRNGEILKSYFNRSDYKLWFDKNGIIVDDAIEAESCDLYASAGSLIDMDTDKLNFDINHPVDIEVQPSYDGSVNLILNDDKNIPRLINSRFSVREKNTYEIVDRIGENDTNIYNSKTFDKDTSLYFQYETNPIIEYKGFIGGSLPVGQYCFYFTYCDADDNESDFISESGLIPVFIGGDAEPFSMNGGIKNESSNKGIKFKLTNMDKSYNYFKIYYVRYFADYQQNRVFEGKKIYKKYPINSSSTYLQITGNENTEDIDPNIINFTRFNPKHILTQAQCKNILFFGNIVKNTDNYRELQDCALRIVPYLVKEDMRTPTYDYITGGNGGYYNSNHIYNKTGYFNQEYYRFGVVFIYQNGTLSNVYNTLGTELTSDRGFMYKTDTLFEEVDIYKKRTYIEIDDDGWIKNSDKFFEFDSQNTYYTLNSKGVCRLNYEGKFDDNTIFGIRFFIDDEVQEFLKQDLGIRGFFFVRQKCVPTILTQCYLLPMDETLNAPVLKYKKKSSDENLIYQTECFVSHGKIKNRTIKYPGGGEIEIPYIDGDRLIVNDYDERLYKYNHGEKDAEGSISNHAYAAICPDFMLNQPYYNQIFNGNKFVLKQITNNDCLIQDDENHRFYKEDKDAKTYFSSNKDSIITNDVTICTVTEDVPTVALRNKTYKLNIGEAEEVYRFGYAEVDRSTYDAGDDDFDSINKATNIVRGKYSPYLAIYSQSSLNTGQLYNIYQYNPDLNQKQEYLNRMNSSEPFYAISDRYNFEQFTDSVTCWRGDCFVNLFTYRLNRNFNDPSLPNNDQIIDKNTWKDHYNVTNQEDWANISRSDINAVQLGSWITIKLRSGVNYALRSVDHSYVSEEALMGSPRSYYPMSELAWRGNNKLPDSYLYNDAFRASLGYKCYFTLQDINYIKDTFSNRIQYSAVSIQDSFKNNYRDSLSTYFRDYSQEYGSIQKLVGFEGHILVVFEHGIGLAVINERILAGTGEGEPVFINSRNVLPEELTIITDTYGTQWPESVVKTESGSVYGVDTIAKKIWRVKGENVELLSDFKVNKFLIDNITLGERELYPIIGLKNVKTHYNNNKKDVMFTFYDDIYKDEEKVWNLCYNELLEQFITFYSWVPSYSENIDTKFFTFNRDTSKALSLLYTSNYNIDSNYGVLLNSPILDLKDYNEEEEIVNTDIGDVEFEPDIPNIQWISSDNLKSKFRWIRTTANKDKSGINEIELYYRDLGASSSTIVTTDGETILDTYYDLQFIPNVTFRLLRDRQNNYKLFEIKQSGFHRILLKDGTTIKEFPRIVLAPKDNDAISKIRSHFAKYKVMYLYIEPRIISDLNVYGLSSDLNFKPEIVAITLKQLLDNPELTFKDKYYYILRKYFTTDFYLHGQAGIFNIKENLYPTHWYGEYHPFEFEFVVNENVGYQKIFNNLIIVSNKAEPESFHFEIEGDNYEFSSDKRTMYFRQEATKNLYQNLGSDILYNRKFTDVTANNYTHEQHYRGGTDENTGRVYEQYKDQYNNKFNFDKVYPIESHGLVRQKKSTIFPLYYEKIDTYNDIYHKYHLMKSSDATYDFQNLSGSEIAWDRDLNQFDVVVHVKNNPINLVGRLRGNSYYKEGRWNVQIPSIIFNQKNEVDWPLVYNNYYDITYDGPMSDWAGNNNPPIPPIVINSQYVPEDLEKYNLSESDLLEDLPNIYTGRLNHPDDNVDYSSIHHDSEITGQSDDEAAKYTGLSKFIDTSEWTARKEARIRDKWMKVRIRYSGKNLAIIHSVITLYNRSYS